jgi:4-aminobutyrate aminotransferase-like enzyme
MDDKLVQRAAKVLPSLTHLDTSKIGVAGYPRFMSHGDGCRVIDVEGRSYIDYMCSFGPILLGHHHPAVDAAVKQQQQLGDCLAAPTAKMVELAELMVATIPWSAFCMFAKNGNDSTVLAVRIARVSRVLNYAPHPPPRTHARTIQVQSWPCIRCDTFPTHPTRMHTVFRVVYAGKEWQASDPPCT